MHVRKAILVSGLVIGGVVVGVVGGAAAATLPSFLSPWGLTSDNPDSTPMPKPDYQVNDSGQSFGSALEAPAPDEEPDLIQVVASNGSTGYVLKTELDKANGSATQFSSPEEALAWQESNAGKSVTLPVYASDGKTVIGDFLVAND